MNTKKQYLSLSCARLRATITIVSLWTFALVVLVAPALAVADIIGTPVVLTRTYLANDGSTFATRQVGSVVVGLSEDVSGQRAFVFRGILSGMRIIGQYYDIAKGARNTTGSLTLTYANGGSTLTRSSPGDVGPDSWQAYLPSQFSYPKTREARFQSITSTDLDGAFKGTDGSRAYVGHHGSLVVYVTERFAAANTVTRPTYASVIIAQRAADGKLTGAFYDLPKQMATLRYGPMIGQMASSPRRFTQNLSANGVLSFASFTADYAVDLNRFAQEISNRLTPFVVGFNYAIAQDGALVRWGAGGARRAVTATNGLLAPLPFTSWTLNEVASTTKTVTLVAVLRALRQRGISVDSPVSPYLPASWVRDVSMNTVTFRQLLSHGLQPVPGNSLFKPNDCDTDFYGCLRDAVAGGMNQPFAGGNNYDNIHYTIFRVILPFVLDPQGMATLFATETDETVLNEQFSARFREAIQSLLATAGVIADFAYDPAALAAYRYTWGVPPTNESAPTGSEDDYLEAGSGGLKMSSREFAQFLSRLEKGLLILPADLATAKAIGFGGTGPMTIAGASAIGSIWGKNGGAGGTASQAMVFPGTEVFITRNSTGFPGLPSGWDSTLLRQAWQVSLIGTGN